MKRFLIGVALELGSLALLWCVDVRLFIAALLTTISSQLMKPGQAGNELGEMFNAMIDRLKK